MPALSAPYEPGCERQLGLPWVLAGEALISFSLLSLEMWVLLGPVDYEDLPNTLALIPVAAPWPVEREASKSPQFQIYRWV